MIQDFLDSGKIDRERKKLTDELQACKMGFLTLESNYLCWQTDSYLEANVDFYTRVYQLTLTARRHSHRFGLLDDILFTDNRNH